MPINVHVPPRMLAKLRGIMTCALGTCMFSAHFWTMGIMTATTGVLLRNALTMAMGSMSRSCAPATVRGRPRSLPMYQSRPPVALIPAATTNRTATVRRPSFANPARPSSTEITPEAIKTPRAPIMTWSGWIRSHRRHPNATITTATVNQPSQGAGDEEEEEVVEADMSRKGGRERAAESVSAPTRAARGRKALLFRGNGRRGEVYCTTPLVEQLFVRGTRRGRGRDPPRRARPSASRKSRLRLARPRCDAFGGARRRLGVPAGAARRGGRAARRPRGAKVPPTPRRRV